MSLTARLVAALALLALAASCGSILPAPPPPPALYRLTPLAAGTAATGAMVPLQLVVDLPTAPAALDTTRIALARSPTTLDYFANAAWTDRPASALQTLIVESLENAGKIRVVARQSAELRADAVLMTDLRDFEAVYGGNGPPEIRVRFDCRLVKWPDRNVIAVRSFTATVPATANETAAIVAGFDDAFHQTMRALAPWAAQTLAPLAR
jgi:cholesterol transport system auxiliary component